ncbi:PrsW family glutamic-type intramembrane protease [Streptomyces sp. NPDC087428]|uniref:PrsW family glutamic-type intramembrane protease n=1 Tax=Streptomyces sp. NPDC087428 TaxID=3365788 RepID=UPI003830F1F3
MAVLMAVAAVWGVLQIFALSCLARSVRLSTVLLAIVVGVYGCGVVTGLIELAYTRLYTEQSGLPLVEVVNTTSYTMAPWVEELIKLTPLLLAGLYAKVRRQWGVTDFVVLGAGLGAGFGLLEGVLRYSLDGHRAIARPGGWVIPDSLSPPYIPGVQRVVTSWLPAPVDSLDMGQAAPAGTATFSHLMWTAAAGLGIGILMRTRGPWRLLSVLPVAAGIAHHTVNNYAAQHPEAASAGSWLADLDSKSWATPLLCLALAGLVDRYHLRRGKRQVPGVWLTTERADGDSAAALIRYAAHRLPWTLVITARFIRARRSLLYATALAPSEESEPLRQAVTQIASRIDATDDSHAWKALNVRDVLTAHRAPRHRRLLWLIPAALMIPSVLFLGIGSFHSTAGLQHYLATGPRPKILLGFAVAALAWIAWRLALLLRTWRAAALQPRGENLAVHRLRLATITCSAVIGILLLYRGLGDAGPTGEIIPAAHLLEALNQSLEYLGLILFLFSLLTFLPEAGALAVVGGGVLALDAAAASAAANLGIAGILLMGVGASGTGPEEGGGSSRGDPPGHEGRPSYTEQDIDAVEHHLTSRFGDPWPPNEAMIERVREAVRSGRPLTEGEENFMAHEMTESRLMDTGMPYDEAHELALRQHPSMKNYDPEVIKQFPEWFNKNWFRAWGIDK